MNDELIKELLGMTKKNAQNKAESMGLTFRLIRIDNQDFFKYPEEDENNKRNDRVCIEIDNGEVTKAVLQ